MHRRTLPLVSVLIIGLVGHGCIAVAQGSFLGGAGYWPEDTNGREVDVFTQNGGKGINIVCLPFFLGDKVRVYANVTYSEWPVQSKDVTFQVIEPSGERFLFSGRTNASGVAAASFVLAKPEEPQGLIGIWTITGSVEIREVVVYDTMEFFVSWDLADVNRDLKVDILDLVAITGAYDATPESPCWNPYADIAEPFGVIDLLDVVLCTSHYGHRYS